MIVRVLKDCRVQTAQLNDLFSALIEYGWLMVMAARIAPSLWRTDGVCLVVAYSSLAELDVWYLHADETRGVLLASWERFLSVCRVLILTMYARID